ncbi:MAG: hypothetical protein KAR13_18990, partial [Desulfobulbaceae bacterium]|nr:hypothetical protein [Desulfobulbaceae bacterium]
TVCRHKKKRLPAGQAVSHASFPSLQIRNNGFGRSVKAPVSGRTIFENLDLLKAVEVDQNRQSALKIGLFKTRNSTHLIAIQ